MNGEGPIPMSNCKGGLSLTPCLYKSLWGYQAVDLMGVWDSRMKERSHSSPPIKHPTNSLLTIAGGVGLDFPEEGTQLVANGIS